MFPRDGPAPSAVPPFSQRQMVHQEYCSTITGGRPSGHPVIGSRKIPVETTLSRSQRKQFRHDRSTGSRRSSLFRADDDREPRGRSSTPGSSYHAGGDRSRLAIRRLIIATVAGIAPAALASSLPVARWVTPPSAEVVADVDPPAPQHQRFKSTIDSVTIATSVAIQ